jgi:hypothetical protein
MKDMAVTDSPTVGKYYAPAELQINMACAMFNFNFNSLYFQICSITHTMNTTEVI